MKNQPLRGLMLDAARLVESQEYYRRFLDFCAEWSVNAVIFRLTDDQGCALRFRSHPELVTHPNALTPEEAQALASYAAARHRTDPRNRVARPLPLHHPRARAR